MLVAARNSHLASGLRVVLIAHGIDQRNANRLWNVCVAMSAIAAARDHRGNVRRQDRCIGFVTCGRGYRGCIRRSAQGRGNTRPGWPVDTHVVIDSPIRCYRGAGVPAGLAAGDHPELRLTTFIAPCSRCFGGQSVVGEA
ncbi:hypothetical protein [Bradyrhizobium sp. JR3.5]